MSIQKKSLISALKTTKKANVASAPLAETAAGQTVTSAKKTISAKRNLSAKSVMNNKKMFGSMKKV